MMMKQDCECRRSSGCPVTEPSSLTLPRAASDTIILPDSVRGRLRKRSSKSASFLASARVLFARSVPLLEDFLPVGCFPGHLAQAGRSTLHAGVGSALADVIFAFSFARASQCNCQPQLAEAALVFSSRATPMSHDPWMEDSNSLDQLIVRKIESMCLLHSHVTIRIGLQQMVRPTLPGVPRPV